MAIAITTMPLGRYGARHIARWSVYVASCEATRCRHRACARAVSARRTPWSSSSPSYENTEIRTKNTSASDYTIIFSIEQWPVKSVMIFRKSHNIWKMLFLYEKIHWSRTQFFSCGGIKYVMYLFLCICPGNFLPRTDLADRQTETLLTEVHFSCIFVSKLSYELG